jgi:outer membrane protein OmpA-like peptidoglycan-associated protein
MLEYFFSCLILLPLFAMLLIMRLFFLSLLVIFQSLSAIGQTDYRINGARKAKAGFVPYEHDVSVQPLDWKGLESSCLTELNYGAWFEVAVKSDRVKFSVHTGGRMGTIADPKLYLGVVSESNGNRAIKEVSCVSHRGSEGVFSIEATGLQKGLTYFILVTSSKEKADFGFSVVDEFEPQVLAPELPATEVIFGRVSGADGNPKSNVKVSLLNDVRKPVASSLTDQYGMFKFEKLPPDQVYLAQLDVDDTELQIEMFLVDEAGAIKSRATKIGDKLYGFGVAGVFADYIRLLAEKDYNLNVGKGQFGIAGRVVDKKTFLFGRAGVKVGLYSSERMLMASSTTDKNGMFSFKDLESSEFVVQVESDRDKDYTEIVIVDDKDVPIKVSNSSDQGADGMFAFRSLPREAIEMKRMEVVDTQMQLPSDLNGLSAERPIILKNILFASASDELLASSYPELDRLAAELTKMNTLRIEVSGHTDDRGSEHINQILSESRAKAVVEYLISKGIESNRLEYKGLGESKPISLNDSEEGRAKNRRVEIVVLN